MNRILTALRSLLDGVLTAIAAFNSHSGGE